MSSNALSPVQIRHYHKHGFVVIENVINAVQRQQLMQRAADLIDEFEPSDHPSIFTTNEQTRTSDDYFLASGGNISFFFEEDAFQSGQLVRPKTESINKLGHAMHILDPIYKTVVDSLGLDNMARQLGMQQPCALQSMHIFKQPYIGGEVGLHQDSTFLYTQPLSCIGFWFALEDADRHNGCLQAMPGGHTIPLKQRFRRASDGGTVMDKLDASPWPDETLALLEVPAGSLVILHGQLPHYSAANTSSRSREAFTLHYVDKACDYPQDNWLHCDLI